MASEIDPSTPSKNTPSEPIGITGTICNWVFNLKLSDVPKEIQHRAKLIILDGLGCGLIGAHLLWSEKAANAFFEFESPGSCSIIGWPGHAFSAPAAALLNSSFVQGFELDDWHPDAPMHSASLLLPALLAAVEHIRKVDGRVVSGKELLLAMVIGLEVGPRIGLGFGGAEFLDYGWHSGEVFGGPAVAAAVSKLFGLSPRQTEWALGTACTTAGGLMSAQFGSMTKRMQHGFASRNGLLAVLLARADYTGIERVLELSYGGFYGTFAFANASVQAIDKEAIFATFGSKWWTSGVSIKPYPLMGGLHASVDCARVLQDEHAEMMRKVDDIEEIKIEMGEAAYVHGGWEVKSDHLEVTGAQMSAPYAVALQFVDWEVVPTSFGAKKLNRSILFELIHKTECVHQKEFNGGFRTRITVTFQDGKRITGMVKAARGTDVKLTDKEIVEKWEAGAATLLDPERKYTIKSSIMKIDDLENLDGLLAELRKKTGSVLA